MIHGIILQEQPPDQAQTVNVDRYFLTTSSSSPEGRSKSRINHLICDGVPTNGVPQSECDAKMAVPTAVELRGGLAA
jgi:hypothetical protein